MMWLKQTPKGIILLVLATSVLVLMWTLVAGRNIYSGGSHRIPGSLPSPRAEPTQEVSIETTTRTRPVNPQSPAQPAASPTENQEKSPKSGGASPGNGPKKGGDIGIAPTVERPQPVQPDPYVPSKDIKDPEILQAEKEAIINYYKAVGAQDIDETRTVEFNVWVRGNRQSVFVWQQTSATIIFWVVILLVICGILFSGVQFYVSLRPKPKRSSESMTELEASIQGIKLSSSLVGIIILCVSFLFFYLYLYFVFPITLASSN